MLVHKHKEGTRIKNRKKERKREQELVCLDLKKPQMLAKEKGSKLSTYFFVLIDKKLI